MLGMVEQVRLLFVYYIPLDDTPLSHILTNIHTYYTQFENTVSENINQLSGPIENGLKVIIKISFFPIFFTMHCLMNEAVLLLPIGLLKDYKVERR